MNMTPTFEPLEKKQYWLVRNVGSVEEVEEEQVASLQVQGRPVFSDPPSPPVSPIFPSDI